MSFGEFNQADTNHDNRLDAGEFRNFLTQNISGAGFGGAGGAGGAYGALGGAGGALGGASEYSSSSYESSSTGNVGAGNFGGNYGASYGSGSDLGLAAGGGSYESSSSSSYSAGGLDAASFGAGSAGYGAASGFDASSYGASGAVGGGSYGASSNDYSSSSSTTAVQTYATDAQGLFRDSNPQVVRRPAPSGPVTYTQNIRVRFLQPPPIAPPGVSLSFHYMLSHYLLCVFSHSSSKKCDHPSHQHHARWLFVNKHPLFLNHHRLSCAKDHQWHHKALHRKPVSSVRPSSVAHFPHFHHRLKSDPTIGCLACASSISDHRASASCSTPST